ncbi:MAG: hypothetical protein M1445_06145, partial [Bacteroidetes bacterium]|nr:hypothetical protein [Bacteroidota bacterium]
MNDDLGKIWFGMGLDNAALEKDALKSKAIIKGIGQTTAETGARMENSFSSVGKGLAMIGGTAAIMMLGKQILDVTAKFEKFGIVLRNTLGEAKGTAALDMIANFAATTPFQLDEVTGAFIKMANQGFVPTQAEMIKLGDLASSTGKGFDQLAEAVLDAQTGEFERLKEFGIKASQNGDKVTFSFKEQKTTVENTNSAIQAYILSLGTLKGVAGANALISASLTGQISNLQDKLSMMFNNIGKANKGLLYDAVGGASSLIDNYETVGEAVKALIAVYGAYKLAVMYVNYEQKIAAAANLLVAESNGFLVASEARVIVMKERSIATQKAFNASVLANPYVLAAMAITALGFALYKVITYQTDLEKAIGKTNLQIENGDDKSSQLFAELNNAAKDTDEWRNAKQRIIDQYGTYLTAQQQEALGLGNIKEARDAVNRGIESTIALKMKEETLTGVSNKFNPTITDESQRIISKVKDKAGADKAYEMQFKLADFVEKSKSGKSTEEEAKALKVELMSLVGGVDGVGHATSMASQNMAAFFNRVTSAISDQKNEIKSVTEAYDKYNIIAKKAAPEAAAPILTTYAAQKKALEDQKKKLEAELAKAKVTPGEDPTKKVVEIQGKIDAINKQLGTKKTNADDKNYELQLKKEQSDLQRAQVDLEQSITKAKIEAMNDGLDKTLAQNQFNYEKEIEQIKRQKEDALTKLHEQEKTLWESKGGKGKFTPTISSLTPEDSAKYDTLSQQARQAKTAADQKASEDALKQYQTYAEKRIDIIKKYNKDTQDVLAAGGTIENVKEVEKEMNEALANLDMSQDKKTSIITRMFADMSNKSVKEINKLVDQTTEFINFLTNPEGYNAADGSFFKVTEEEYKKLTSDP